MADDYDPLDPPTYDAAHASYDDEEDAQDLDDTDDKPNYDPSTAQAVPPQPISQPPSRVGSIQPRSVAPFTEDSDDEETAIPQINGMSEVQSAQDVSLGSAPLHDTTSAVPSAQETVSPVGSHAASAALNGPMLAVTAPTPVSLSATPLPAAPVQQPPANVPVPNGAVNTQTQSTQRLAHDKVGQLEDRISDEPRADPEAWLNLIQYYKGKDQLDNVRKTYDRFVEVFPTSPSLWLAYLSFEQEQDEHQRIDGLLNRALLKVPSVDLWLFYLNVLRRRHPLLNDSDGKNRAIITQAFDFVLENVGSDPDAGQLWREYIDFIKSGPGQLTANSNHWQDQQKIDLLRKAYGRAVSVPHDDLMRLWKDYDSFELSFGRAAGRKFLSERSPHYMTAKAAKTQLDEKLYGLDRKSLPELPPLPGYDGDARFAEQIKKWDDWVEWEKSDELVLKESDLETYRKRVNYALKHATMSLRFYPEIWFKAASWCFEQGTETWRKEGEAYLDAGITANPESSLLALRKADLVEASFRGKGDSDETVISNGNKLDAVFEKVHGALYALKKKHQERETKIITDMQAYFEGLPPEEDTQPIVPEEDEDEEDRAARPKTRQQQQDEQTQAIKVATAALQDTLKRTISYVWVAKLRAFRRIQGQGKPKDAKKGFRGVFAEARPRGSLTSDVYVASALMEHYCYGDIAATKIFERGLKLYPTDEYFILEYIKHLISKNDPTNAKAVFEMSITRIEKTEAFTAEQKRDKCRPLLVYMYHFESNYGELAAVQRLEKRMADMYPAEPAISRFSQRFELPGFDANRAMLVLSPIQMRPKAIVQDEIAAAQPIPSIEDNKLSPQPGQMLLGPHGPYLASPKRPLDDSEDGTPSRKFMRGESPLKGAAGRRIATVTAANIASGGSGGFVTKSYVPSAIAPAAAPQPLPPGINVLLSILPNAATYQATRFDPHKMVDLLRTIDLTRVMPGR